MPCNHRSGLAFSFVVLAWIFCFVLGFVEGFPFSLLVPGSLSFLTPVGLIGGGLVGHVGLAA